MNEYIYQVGPVAHPFLIFFLLEFCSLLFTFFTPPNPSILLTRTGNHNSTIYFLQIIAKHDLVKTAGNVAFRHHVVA